MTPRFETTWCTHCDLARVTCPHRQIGDVLVARRPYVPATENLESWSAYYATEKNRVDWRTYFDGADYGHQWQTDITDDGGIVECGDSHESQNSYLCRNCKKLVLEILGDLPALMYDLSLAATRQSAFVERGTQLTGDDVSPLPYDEAASRCVADLLKLLGVARLDQAPQRARMLAAEQPYLLNPKVVGWAHRLSLASRRGHRIIERPEPLVYYGPCPTCAVDLYGPREWAVIVCPCGYQKTAEDHRKAALDLGEDRWMTVGELVGAITLAGEAVTRDQIGSWIRTKGLPRELGLRPLWRDGQLVDRFLFVYRLGDVRDLALRRSRANDPDAA
jgi:hypothetical protein